MPVEWHPKGWWDWYMSEDEKMKKIHFLLKSAKSCQNDFIACQFVTIKMLEKFLDALLANYDMSFLMRVLIKSHFC